MDSKIKFLVPVAFTPQTDIITEQACNLAERYNAEVTLLYVFDTSRTKGFFSKPEDESQIKQNAQKQFDDFVRREKLRCKTQVKGVLVEGRVYETIVAVSKSINANLIIMGTNGAVGIKSQFIGSNTMRVIKEATCPVLTIKGKNHRKGCHNIVLPLDLTKDTTQKVEYAIQFAKIFGDSTIRAISVLDTTSERVVKKLTSQMMEVESHIEQSGVDCCAEIVKIIKGEDNLPSAIIAYAEKIEADIIMIMTQQENNPTEFFIGSKAQTIINKSLIPVMSFVPRGTNALNYL